MDVAAKGVKEGFGRTREAVPGQCERLFKDNKLSFAKTLLPAAALLGPRTRWLGRTERVLGLINIHGRGRPLGCLLRFLS